MNTLLGEIATLNDVQYPRYRIAFKLRKLQKFLFLDQVDVSLLQEALHLSGVGALQRKDLVPASQLHSVVVEMFSCLRVQKPALGSAKLQQAQELCSNWLQMNYECATGGKVEVGSLKITLCLLCGGKPAEKARYMFSVLANARGSMESCDVAYFCTVTRQLAGTLQEQLYEKWGAEPEGVWRSCLVFVRCAEDIEDEECDGGGIKRQWLSQFEFSKLFTEQPEPAFLGWLALFQRLPAMEKVVHSVRCAVCTRKPICSFRYQCTQCSNVSLCQMCFLKGRVTEKHSADHAMVEFSAVAKSQKSWHQRLKGTNPHLRGGRVWDEPKAAFVYSPRNSMSLGGRRSNNGSASELSGSPMHAISDMLTNSQQHDLTNSFCDDHTHKPTSIHVGKGGMPENPKPAAKTATTTRNNKQTATAAVTTPTSHRKGGSISTASSGSPDSVSSGGKFHYDGPLGSTSSGEHFLTSSVSYGSDLQLSPAHNAAQDRTQSSRQQDNLKEINRKLSLEVDMLLNDLPKAPPTSTPFPKLSTHSLGSYKVPNGHAYQLQQQGKALEGQVTNLTNKREQLAEELEGLISHVQNIHVKSLSLSRGVRTGSPSAEGISLFPVVGPAHLRSDSLPAEAYLSPATPSPPTGISPLLSRKVHSPTMPPTKKASSQEILSPTMTSDLAHPDCMAEYVPTADTEWNHAHPEMHRISVAW